MSKRIFISHAVKDKAITDAFIDLILNAGLAINVVRDVFCVSNEGTGIRTGTDWRDSIKDALIGADVVFIFISPYYKESEVCQNEMGAAWVLNSNTIPFVIEPLTFDAVGVLAQVKQIAKLLDDSALDNIKDILVKDLELPIDTISSARWTLKKKEFIGKCHKYLSENKYPKSLSRDEFEKIIKENNELNEAITVQFEEAEKNVAMIKELKNAKDKQDVKRIEAKYDNTDTFDEFERMATDVAKRLNGNANVINGIIFNDYFKKGLTIDFQTYKYNIDAAVAENEIDGEELTVNWQNRNMRQIKDALDSFDSLMIILSSDEEFLKEFEDRYKCDFELDNKTFWKKVFATTVVF